MTLIRQGCARNIKPAPGYALGSIVGWQLVKDRSKPAPHFRVWADGELWCPLKDEDTQLFTAATFAEHFKVEE